jgi:hypothetical protein
MKQYSVSSFGTGTLEQAKRVAVREVADRLGDRVPEPRRRQQLPGIRPPVFVRCPYLLTDYFGHIVTSIAETLVQHGQAMVLEVPSARYSSESSPVTRAPIRSAITASEVATTSALHAVICPSLQNIQWLGPFRDRDGVFSTIRPPIGAGYVQAISHQVDLIHFARTTHRVVIRTPATFGPVPHPSGGHARIAAAAAAFVASGCRRRGGRTTA